ncbi:MAG: xylulokinase [Lachnospiraceae bacterium]|nr:xylulokinase [Lachnospiraceae bacterium]
MEYYVGIDIGTSSAKLILIDNAGKMIKESNREYEILEPRSGWKEIDPETWMSAVDEAMKELLDGIDSAKVQAIGVTGQMHTVVFIGNDGASIRPALMWNDTRTANELAGIKEQIQHTPNISYIANIISTGSPAMNLLWLKKYEPKHFREIKKFLIGPDYIVYRLTGSCQTDYCEASTSSLFDLRTGKWSSEIRQIFGFPENIYPEVKVAGEIAGEVTDNWKKKYGFKNGVKVITGTGDNPAAAISTGCLAKKYPVLSLGTSGVLMYPKKEFDFSAKGKNIMFSLERDNIQILVQGVVQSCGSSMNWWIKHILNSNDFAKETEVNIDHLGENQLLFYPHLVGDKTIYADSSLRGAFLGIGTDTSRSDMTIAVMEGICFGVKQLIEVMKVSEQDMTVLKVTGGGSKNNIWMQIMADVLNVKIEQMESGAGAGYGIALAALANNGDVSMEDVIDQTVSIKKIFTPREYNQKLYQKKYQKYQKIHGALKQVF